MKFEETSTVIRLENRRGVTGKALKDVLEVLEEHDIGYSYSVEEEDFL